MERVSIPWATALMLYKTGEMIQWYSEDNGTWYSIFGPEIFAANKQLHYRILPNAEMERWRDEP